MTTFPLRMSAPRAHPGLSRGLGRVALAAAGIVLTAAAAVALGPPALAIPLAVAGVWFFVREPLALLVLFVYIGLFKEEAIVAALPVDATLLLGALLTAICFVRLVTGRARAVPTMLTVTIAVLGLALVLSLSWTPAEAYGWEKSWKFLTLTMAAMLAPFCLIEDADDLRRLAFWTVCLAVIAGGMAALNPPAADAGRLVLGAGGSTIGVSRLLCVAAIILLLSALGSAETTPRVAGTLGGIALIAVAAAVGSRGPLVSLLLALGSTAAVWLVRVPRNALPVLLVVIAGLAVVPFISLPEASERRLSAVANDPVGAFQADDRSFLYDQAFELIDQNPLRGAGVGAFSEVSLNFYPHNMFLELWSELGILTMALVAGAIIVVLLGLYRAAWFIPDDRTRQMVYIMTAVFLFALSAVQVSGDINDNREFWLTFGLAWLVVRYGIPPGRSERA